MFIRAKVQMAAALLPAMAVIVAIEPAAAQERPVVVHGESAPTRVERVKFADLDLATRSGARRLDSRVGAAVKSVCLFDREIRLQPSDYSECAGASWDRARPQIAQAIARSQALAASGQPATAAMTIAVSAR